ncbi:MAG: hypothetical protein LBC62_04865 [Treponema sp.]|nr:hypothetical protein [Treponema sp.]
MGISAPRRRFFLAAAILLMLVIPGGVFMLRQPVLIVTDSSFNLIYGNLRTRLKQAESSLRLYRRMLMVPVAESAGPDVIALAVKAVSPSPYAVLFPYRYGAAARRYSEEYPGVPALVLGGRPPVETADSGTLAVHTDTSLDFYRAGLCAALFAQGTEGAVLVFHDGTITAADREAFLKGLRAQGFTRNPVYLSLNSDYSSWQNVSCVVVNGAAARFFDQNLKIPVILFSWIDPGITPRSVKAVFDDSPWALAVRAVRLAGKGGGVLPSEAVLLPRRVRPRETAEKLRELVRELPIGENGKDL